MYGVSLDRSFLELPIVPIIPPYIYVSEQRITGPQFSAGNVFDDVVGRSYHD
jgi:hypothetical protein